MAKSSVVELGPKATGDLRVEADSWDGPHFRPFICGINDYRTTPPDLAMFLDANLPLGTWEYVLSGSIYLRTGTTRQRVGTGEALVVRRPDPGWIVRPVKDVPVQTLWFNVTGEPALRMFDYLLRKYGQIQRFPVQSRVVRLARQLVQMIARQPYAPAHAWSERTFRLMNAWWECAMQNHRSPDPSVLETGEASKLMPYASRSMKTFAMEMGYSRAYLTRRLTEQWKRSPGQVLREARMLDGALLLRTTSLTVSEIALKVGYSTSASFSRAFLKHYSESPRVYRQRHR